MSPYMKDACFYSGGGFKNFTKFIMDKWRRRGESINPKRKPDVFYGQPLKAFQYL